MKSIDQSWASLSIHHGNCTLKKEHEAMQHSAEKSWFELFSLIDFTKVTCLVLFTVSWGIKKRQHLHLLQDLKIRYCVSITHHFQQSRGVLNVKGECVQINGYEFYGNSLSLLLMRPVPEMKKCQKCEVLSIQRKITDHTHFFVLTFLLKKLTAGLLFSPFSYSISFAIQFPKHILCCPWS